MLDIMIVDEEPSEIIQTYYDEENEVRYYENQDSKRLINPAIDKVIGVIQNILQDVFKDKFKYEIKLGRQVTNSKEEAHYKKISIIGDGVENHTGRIWNMIVMLFSEIASIVEPRDYSIQQDVVNNENNQDQSIVTRHINIFLTKNNSKKISRRFTVNMMNNNHVVNHLKIDGEWSSDGMCMPKKLKHEPIQGRVSSVNFSKGEITVISNGKRFMIKYTPDHCKDIKIIVEGCGQKIFKFNVKGVEVNDRTPIQIHYVSVESL